MTSGMPASISFVETYYNTTFLQKLCEQKASSPVMPEHVALGTSLTRRLRGKNSSKVEYAQRKYSVGNGEVASLGRFFPLNKGFVSYPGMLGSLRRVLADGKYAEVDLRNAHIRILVDSFASGDIPLRGIESYASRRDEVLEQVCCAANVPRWAAKELFIRMTYGGSVNAWLSDHNVAEDVMFVCQTTAKTFRLTSVRS